MGPIITEVENVEELLPRLQTCHLEIALIGNRLIDVQVDVDDADASSVAQLELVKV